MECKNLIVNPDVFDTPEPSKAQLLSDLAKEEFSLSKEIECLISKRTNIRKLINITIDLLDK